MNLKQQCKRLVCGAGVAILVLGAMPLGFGKDEPVAKATATKVPVTITGGYATDPRDRGRPVILIAAALGVKPEVFRQVFRGVHPAGPGRGGPTREEAQANKRVLLDGLGKYGVTNERLDEVSNYYRYPPGSRSLWRHRAAAAEATLLEGSTGTTVTLIIITDAGAGYTSPPAVSIPNHPELKLLATVAYGRDLASNGGLRAISMLSTPKDKK